MSFANFFENAKKRRADQLNSNPPPIRSNINDSISQGTSNKKQRTNKKKKNKKVVVSSSLIKNNKSTDDDLFELIRSHENHVKQQSKQNSSQSIRRPASQEALELSSKLKALSNQKRLNQALKLYYDRTNDKIRDDHHGSIMIDCCSRCGDIKQGEKIFKEMLESKGKNNGQREKGQGILQQLSVQAYTALMKGYAHSGQMHKAVKLFHLMWTFKGEFRHENGLSILLLFSIPI